MIYFLRFFFLVFCFFSFSQSIGNDFLLVAKDSVSFYSFAKKGVTYYRFDDQNTLTKNYVNYSRPIPKKLESIGLNSVSAVSSGNVVYFLYPGGGILYRFKNNAIERIDESFPHKNQFSGHFFVYKESLYLLGGYGYWTTKNYLTKFNFQSGNWDFIPSFGQVPEDGINQGSFIKKGNILYVFDFYATKAGSNIYNRNLFHLNLDSFTWSKKGTINSSFIDDIEKSRTSVKVPFKKGLFQARYNNKNVSQIIAPSINSIKYYKNTSLDPFDRNSIIVGNNLVSLVLDSEEAASDIVFKNLDDFLLFEQEGLLYNDTFVFVTYLFIVGGILLLLILFVFFYFKKAHKIFYFSEDSLFTEEKAISLNIDEKYFLSLLTKSPNETVENALVLNYFNHGVVSLDAAIKRKNKMIAFLNSKFFQRYGIVLIQKKPDEKDSRQVLYFLSKSLKVIAISN